MEKKEQVVKMGVLRLLPGFRFHPTDQELVLDYLKRKAFSFPLPASIIPVVLNLSNSDPWDLPGDLEQERYFFSTRDIKYPSTSGGNYRSNRATSSGYWKATGLDKKILVLGGGRGNNHQQQQQQQEVVGMKKTLVFYTRKPPHGSSSRTHWIMHEYRLTLPPQSHQEDQVHNWVLCRIFPKKRGIAKNRVDDDDDEKITQHTHNIDTVHSSTLGKNMKKKNSPPVFMANQSSTKKRRRITDLNVPASTSSSSSSSSSSSASSGITEASDHGESSSCCCSNNTNNK